ncbi:phosphoenolpyruvate carboxylase [Aureitalea sp. L0-47]|uniref:phosphoenolpyruvate carboxylase n=1 Tax=Aureitalea sp. L0-47 TaxID=2816962 RepID=UPI0022388B33|nr:phosphoenolpyruvate carboxylase [Aureitalea sp. L0-47]MCW5519066.1 phosphoenolpyruvate carboxylase [Aureitalea sp. L0-47]
MKYTKEERFNTQVLSRYQIYNSVFMTLPFDAITRTGVLLPLFQDVCEAGFRENKNPTEIVTAFFQQFTDQHSEKEQINLLFRFIQYIERQVVLFDAVEDAAFTTINNMDGIGTLRNIKEEANDKNKKEELKDYLKHFKIRPVLTAHPTQFYPGNVLGIITDLAKAIDQTDLEFIKKLLAQLGKTPFFKKQKPTPYDEAVRLIWYLENVFYHSASEIFNYIRNHIYDGEEPGNQIIQLGFWPGGDRDGNPFVTTETTLQVAFRLRSTLLKNYYRDLRALRRRVTFEGVDILVQKLEAEVYANIALQHGKITLTASDIKEQLKEIRAILIADHQSLFVEMVDDLINKITLFGMHFASLDIRQDSRIHSAVMEKVVEAHPELFPKEYDSSSEEEKIDILTSVSGSISEENITEELASRTLGSIRAMKVIQENNGEEGCNRYIISNNQTAVNVMEVFTMIRLCDWNEPTVDIVPLFETVDDLQAAADVMECLYTNPLYANHLKKRQKKQSIMLGFSDGTKDGGYLMANWSIFTAKERLTEISRKHGIKVVFFDGRGGPPARGGGKTHQFYASLGPTVEREEVQLTIQGQTISSNFGTRESCQYNMEQLLSSGITNAVFTDESEMTREERETMTQLAEVSYGAYSDFKAHPMFLPYLERMSTLKYYAKTNIGSRPSKRGKGSELVFSDLRAIPFVGSWSQLKQNVPGFYGVGHALEEFKKAGAFDKVKALYNNSLFFRTLLENSMMSLSKSFFPLTAYMKDDPEFGEFWTIIYNEYRRTRELLLELSGYEELMEDSKAMKASIAVREQIVLPLLTIQQYALREIQKLRKEGASEKDLEVWEKMVTRSLFGNINASRNSA